MEKKWSVLFCDPYYTPCPAFEFLESCKPAHQIKVIHFLELLEETGPTLPRPYADLLRDGIHELRIKLAGDQVRFLYFFYLEKFIILYRAMKKRSSAVPEKFIRDALRYRQSLINRLHGDVLERHAKLGAYLDHRCSEPEFKDEYDRHCNICSNTVAIISKMQELGITVEEMSRRTGVATENLLKLETADWCSYSDVRKLCRALGLREPQGCAKERFEN